MYKKKSLHIAFLAASTCFILSGCGGGGSSNSASVDPVVDTDEQVVNGSGVKGPMTNATVKAYVLDYRLPGLRGELIATGTTDDSARVQGLTISTRRLGPFLIEFSEGVDHTTNAKPVIPVLKTILTKSNLLGTEVNAEMVANPIFATPLSTLVVEMARWGYVTNSAGEISTTNFSDGLTAANTTIKTYLGFGLLTADDGVDLLTTAPLLVEDGSNVNALNYRTASESFSALFADILSDAQAIDSSVTAEQLLQYIAQDLFDQGIDGKNAGVVIEGLVGIDVYARLTQDVSDLYIPGTSIPIADINTLLITEAEDINPTAAEGAVTLAAPSISILVPGVDGDGDGIIDLQDDYPEDEKNFDEDGDGVVNDMDTFPFNPRESADTDEDCNTGALFNPNTLTAGDGCGDATDYRPTDPSVQIVCDLPDEGETGATQEDIAAQESAGCYDDSDGDGRSRFEDMFPDNFDEYTDSDLDCFIGVTPGEQAPGYIAEGETAGNGCGDTSDEFPNNPQEQTDTDGDFTNSPDFTTYGNDAYQLTTAGSIYTALDGGGFDPQSTYVENRGYGDNSDRFINDGDEWADCDNDSLGDNADPVPCGGYVLQGTYADPSATIVDGPGVDPDDIGNLVDPDNGSTGNATTQSTFFLTGYDVFGGTLTGDVVAGLSGSIALETKKIDTAFVTSVDFTITPGASGDITASMVLSNFSCVKGPDVTPEKDGCGAAMGNPSPTAPHVEIPDTNGPPPPDLIPGSDFPGGGIVWLDTTAANGDLLMYWSRSNGAFDQYDTYTFEVIPAPAY